MRNGFTLPKFSDLTIEQPSLEQFVLLSMMLHVLAIILFGDTNGGGARRGEKLWGALTVTVQALLPGNGLKPGNYVAPLQAPVTPSPSAPASAGKESLDKRARSIPPVENPSPAEESAPPSQAPAFAMPPVIAKEVEKAETEFVVPKPSVDRVYAPQIQAQPSEPAPREAPPIPPPPTPVPAAITPLPVPVALPIIERAALVPMPAPSPVEAAPREVPAAPTPTPTPLPTPVAAPSMPTPVSAPPIPVPAPAAKPEPALPKVVPEVAKPVVVAPPPPAPAVAPAPPKPEREVVPPAAPVTDVKPREIPAPAAAFPPAASEPPRVETPKVPKIEREIITPAATPSPTVATPTSTATQIRTPAGAPPGTPTAAERDLLKPRGDTATAPPDSAGLPATPALGKAPALDLDAIRRRAREINSGTGPRTVFPFPIAPVPKPKTKEQQAFDKALKKNDCRDAYADMGLAAVVPLVISAVRDDGCKW